LQAGNNEGAVHGVLTVAVSSPAAIGHAPGAGSDARRRDRVTNGRLHLRTADFRSVREPSVLPAQRFLEMMIGALQFTARRLARARTIASRVTFSRLIRRYHSCPKDFVRSTVVVTDVQSGAKCRTQGCGKAVLNDSYICGDCSQELIALHGWQEGRQPSSGTPSGSQYWHAIRAAISSCIKMLTRVRPA
jgi:hypothetical protein